MSDIRPVVEIKEACALLIAAEKASEHACTVRAALDAGTSRARITTANARWSRAAEYRDRREATLRELMEKYLGGSS
jgi:hypothetical protein